MIPVAEPWITETELKYASDAVESGWVAKGEYIKKFENRCAEFLGVKHAFAVSSGTAALEVALRALNPDKKEVITNSCSCSSNANAILHAGYMPVFVDVTATDFNINVEEIESHLTPETGVIMPIHLFGQPCDMDPIVQIAKKHNLPVIEDCAQAFGAKYKGRPAGSFGEAACFSFYSNKIITTGEGGLVVTNSREIADRVHLIRNHGQDAPFNHVIFGSNFKMTNIQAAVGFGQMEKIQEIVERRRANAQFYYEHLKQVAGIVLPEKMPGRDHVFFCFPIVLKEGSGAEFRQYLQGAGIETRPVFTAMSEQPYFKRMFPNHKEKYPVNDRLHQKGFYVSCSPTLKKEDLEHIVSSIKEGLKARN